MREASDATSALTLLDQRTFDVIVSDVGMPELDGLSFLRLLRARPPERGGKTPAVAVTAYTRGVDRTAALRAGFQAHVPKPVEVGELLAVIASLCGRL